MAQRLERELKAVEKAVFLQAPCDEIRAVGFPEAH